MIDLNTVVQAIAEHSLKLLRTADSIRIEGSCPAELAKAIEHHAASLLPFAAIDPAHSEKIAEQQAAADSDSIRQQLDDFAKWIVTHHAWVAVEYTQQQHIDSRLNPVVDGQRPAEVAATIASLKTELDAIDWATRLFPVALETEAKHAAENRTFTEQDHPDCPFSMVDVNDLGTPDSTLGAEGAEPLMGPVCVSD
jgi:hypothetical protein